MQLQPLSIAYQTSSPVPELCLHARVSIPDASRLVFSSNWRKIG
jgi:hypothetical protein